MIIGNNNNNNSFNQSNNFQNKMNIIKENAKNIGNNHPNPINTNQYKDINNSNEMLDRSLNMLQDRLNKGLISYEEFLRVTIDENILLEKNNLKFAFDKFDLNKDGKLSKEELLNILDKGASDYVDALLNLIDKNQDGYISFDEFCHLMSKVAEQ